MNVDMLRKVAAHIEKHPENYHQNTWVRNFNETGCGTAACIAGWTVALGDPALAKGHSDHDFWSGLSYDEAEKVGQPKYVGGSDIAHRASELLGMPDYMTRPLFGGNGLDWPQPYQNQYMYAGGSEADRVRANTAAQMLRDIADGKVTFVPDADGDLECGHWEVE